MTRPLALHTAVVTGAAGFLGSHLAPALAAIGCRPVLLSRNASEQPAAAGAVCYPLDVRDSEALDSVFASERPDVVFHLAGVRSSSDDASELLSCVEINVSGTIRVLEAARRAGVKRVVLAGSAEEYGYQSGPQSERSAVRPETVYGVTKAAATCLAQQMYTHRECPVVVLRPYSVYGPLQPEDRFVAQAVRCAVTGTPFRMTAGEQRRDLVFVDDTVAAFIAAATTAGIDGEVINIGSGQAHRLREIAELIWELSASKAPLMIGARPAEVGELNDTWAEISKATSLLGWKPRVDLRTGLAVMIECVRSRIGE